MPVINEVEVRGIVVGVFQENCYIVASARTREAVAIDPGDEPQRVLDLARDMGVRIKLIVGSHAHVDHILGIPGVQEKTSAPFLMHHADMPTLSQADQSITAMLGTLDTPRPVPDGFVADGETISVAGLDLRVIHTPGHTPGSVSYYVNGLLFSGDTLFRGSIGRTDFPGGSFPNIIQSITTRLLALPDETIVLPGHQLETTIRQERFTNPFILQAIREREA